MSGDNTRNFFLWVNGGDRLNIHNNGNVGIATTSPSYTLDVNGSGRISRMYVKSDGNDVKLVNDNLASTVDGSFCLYQNPSGSTVINCAANQSISMKTNNNSTTAMTIINSGNVGIGVTSPSYTLQLGGAGTSDKTFGIYYANPNGNAFEFRRTNFSQEVIVCMRYPGGSVASADTSKNGSFSVGGEYGGRSINATGSINAGGSDYAEYMIKNGDFVIPRGDIVGVDSNGLLTNIYSQAITFVIKSTNPSFVGGDTWNIADQSKVDRIAFCGQVPVNLYSAAETAAVGDYIVPIAAVDDTIGVITKSFENITFDQYKKSVGRIISKTENGVFNALVKII
jgi:hypothetical protein